MLLFDGMPVLLRRSSLWRGAWIETRGHCVESQIPNVAPLYGEGRGLKQDSNSQDQRVQSSLLSMERGVD